MLLLLLLLLPPPAATAATATLATAAAANAVATSAIAAGYIMGMITPIVAIRGKRCRKVSARFLKQNPSVHHIGGWRSRGAISIYTSVHRTSRMKEKDGPAHLHGDKGERTGKHLARGFVTDPNAYA